MDSEQRDWSEYLEMTRCAGPGQYEATEERAWSRLQAALFRRRLTAPGGFPPREQPLHPQGEGESDPSRPVGGSDA